MILPSPLFLFSIAQNLMFSNRSSNRSIHTNDPHALD